MFDYDFNRERIFLEIAEAEISARREAEATEARAASNKADSDEELSRQVCLLCGHGGGEETHTDALACCQSAKLSLSSSSNGLRESATKPRSSSEEDVAAAISASLREY